MIETKRPEVDLCRAMRAIHQRGWCDGTGGNFSCRLRREPLQLLMAPSGVDKGSLRPRDLIVVDGEGSVTQGGGRPSAETLLHIALMEEADAGAVLHTHSQAGTLISLLELEQAERTPAGGRPAFVVHRNLEMLKGLEGIRTHSHEVEVPVFANDQDIARLAATVKPLLPRCAWGFLVAGHGLYAWGSDLASARRHLEIHEFLLEQRWRCLLLERARHHSGSGPSGQAEPWDHRP